jgi:hypothetical protein
MTKVRSMNPSPAPQIVGPSAKGKGVFDRIDKIYRIKRVENEIPKGGGNS